MSHSERCPLCDGNGTLPNDGRTTSAVEPTCHGCYGRGWIEVMDDTPSPVPLQAPESPVSG